MAMMQYPVINCIQKIAIYETKARYYVVGSNNCETRFRVLKIDRTEPKDLVITDDKVEYTQKEVRDLLMMIDVGNRTKQQHKTNTKGLSMKVSSFGIVGFVRFLEGYYVVHIRKRRKVALIGPHTIYKIEDTNMVYIPNDTVRFTHPDEQRYVKMFQNVDLSSNFYFSYSYDLTHSLQYNLAPCKGLDPSCPQTEDYVEFWRDSVESTENTDTITDLTEDFDKHGESEAHSPDEENQTNEKEKAEAETKDTYRGEDAANNVEKTRIDSETISSKKVVVGVRTEPTRKYVWNNYMLSKMEEVVHPGWLLYVIHGFIGQSKLVVYGKPIYLTLIARRSNTFAGTRFLKRGANHKGEVANEVETEQIVHDACMSSLNKARLTSFTQLRGSLPLQWSQDIARMMPKPNIILDQTDPYGYVAGQHFNDVMMRFGAPIIILNLVKKREKKKHESILTEELVNVLDYLNQFLPADYTIKHIRFDMARVSKSENSNVLMRLAEIADMCVKKTGFFQTSRGLYCNTLRPHERADDMNLGEWDYGNRQIGVVRTNCVDCLDRTNTAQFAIGKCAMAYQLYALGIIHNPNLEFDTDCVRMLEELYEDHGDTLALQYGGSQLVHRIKGYRKVAPWTSSSNDIMQTMSRYYSNAFSDADKQHAINLFLGIFQPKNGEPNIWELPTDYYLHNEVARAGPVPRDRSYSQWWAPEVVKCFPYSAEEELKGSGTGNTISVTTTPRDERINMFFEHYKPYELTSFDEHYSIHMPNSIRDFMPKFATSYSPFALRVRPGRRQEEYGSSTTEANPNITGKESTISTQSTGSSDSSSESSGSDIDGDIDLWEHIDHPLAEDESGLVCLKDLFPSMADTYGIELHEPNKTSESRYKKYVHIGTNATKPRDKKDIDTARKGTELIQKSTFPLDSSYNVEPPTVNVTSKKVYDTFVKRGNNGADNPNLRNRKLYQQYLHTQYL